MTRITRLPEPSNRAWREREVWFEAGLARLQARDRRLNEQAAALLAELRLVFCAGAWASALILAQTVLDAALADTEAFDGLEMNELRFGRDQVWLRNRRNDLVHNDKPTPELTQDDLTRHGAELEADARRAVSLLFKSLGGG